MQAASAFLALLSLAASSPHESFRYEISSSVFRMVDLCKMCYGDDCVEIDVDRCQYFVEIDEVADKPEEDGEGSPVDDMISELTEQGAMSWWAQECIPLISEHSNCNKENLCIGCEECSCSSAGRWSCKQVQRCRADVKTYVSHRTLVSVMEKLLEDETKPRRKRFIDNGSNNPEAGTISLMDIASWMYEVPASNKIDSKSDTNITMAKVTNYTPNTVTFAKFITLTPPAESEYIGFEEVLNNIVNDDKKASKVELDEKRKKILDYMDIEDLFSENMKPKRNKTHLNATKTTQYNEIYSSSDNIFKVLNAIEEENLTETISNDKFVVDLYPHDVTTKKILDDNITADFVNFLTYKENNNTIDLYGEGLILDPSSIMKRDVSFIHHLRENNTRYTTIATTAIKPTLETYTSTEKNISAITEYDRGYDLNDSVLIPLTNIIQDNQREIEELSQIKTNLLRIIQMHYNRTETGLSKYTNVENESNADFSVSNSDLFPEIQENLRNINPNVIDKLLYKLKRDIYEVFRDIARFQKLSHPGELPHNLKLLIRALKAYVTKQMSIQNFQKNDVQFKKNNSTTRKLWMRRISTDSKSFAKQLVDILIEIDKNNSASIVFSNLSKSAKKLIKRIIKQNSVDDYSEIELRIFDKEYNLTKELRTIGKNWPQITAKLANCSPHAKLYALKLLHLSISGDVNKLTDAIALINFAYTRRMTPIEIPMAEEVIERINDGLYSIKNKVQTLIKYQVRRDQAQLQDTIKHKKKKKDSFFKRIRNMLRSSKKEIVNMAKKKVPKSEIFKTIAQKKLHELAQKKLYDDEITMMKWQKNLHVTKRKKRDLSTRIKTMKRRMKCIIPKYLRGKLTPAIAKQKSKTQSGMRQI